MTKTDDTPAPVKVVALLAAAGQGTRLGANLPKAYVPLAGESLLVRSVRTMVQCAIIDEIIVVVSADMRDYAQQLLVEAGLLEQHIPISLVSGGKERADSIWAGLQQISSDEAVVLVHDAARALTPPEMITRVAQAVLAGKPAVIPVLPVSDTIKIVHDDCVVDTPDRAQLRAVQTPQGFQLSHLRRANRAYYMGDHTHQFIPTDDASLMEWHGHRISCVPGDSRALKITTPLDFALAEIIVQQDNDPSQEVEIR
ncbi:MULTISPECIES: 2-C-methyl-D-erythritol 4-phosphate cytidylyltransferase [unclassified Corynebacterium]|uniref:2-C-methyl-D-erythritol 4-phosphate cytidylyltransferase n=1 Tax=unclassified Corynebacterium TaxID=2624378 RepID=UPI001FEF81C8|nr:MULTISPECIES: 2-C-methyl-D-erythritol 4-phosphate cytidylyltransferase [unclassified Corynebacterium]